MEIMEKFADILFIDEDKKITEWNDSTKHMAIIGAQLNFYPMQKAVLTGEKQLERSLIIYLLFILSL